MDRYVKMSSSEFDRQFGEKLVAALPKMKGVARFYMYPGDDEDDILQETALLAWKFRLNYRGEATFITWLGHIVRNIVSSQHRRERGQARIPRSFMQLGDGYDTADLRIMPADEAAAASEQRSIVFREIANLRPSYQRALEMRLLEIPNGPTSTRKVHVYRAMLILRGRLKNHRTAA
jgi:RNA polymerase sigma factor (sigma-70 family)